MKKSLWPALVICILIGLTGCGKPNETAENSSMIQSSRPEAQNENSTQVIDGVTELFTINLEIAEITQAPAFEDFGRLLFPVDDGYWSGDTLGNLRLTWYNNIDPNKTVEIVNTLWQRASAGDIIFYDIYTEGEKADPDKEDTGLFFFRGEPGAKFAVCNAGGGFVYVGAMQDSFPHALELSKQGYKAFALIYRPGAQTACEDLARALNTRKNRKWTQTVTLSGAVPQVQEWPLGWKALAIKGGNVRLKKQFSFLKIFLFLPLLILSGCGSTLALEEQPFSITVNFSLEQSIAELIHPAEEPESTSKRTALQQASFQNRL